MMKQIKAIMILILGFFGCFSKKDKKQNPPQKIEAIKDESKSASFEEQLKIFEALGYKFNEGVNKKMILGDVYEMNAFEINAEDEIEKYIEQNPFSCLYYIYGYGNVGIPKNNYSEDCMMFDLEWFDPNSQYKYFMERMGIISNGEINFSNIEITTDADKWEWISFEVNGISKKWKLEKEDFIADHYIQRFSHLPSELNTKGKYTYYDDGGQAFVIDYATEQEQNEFNNKTGLKREWLGEGNHFNEPKD